MSPVQQSPGWFRGGSFGFSQGFVSVARWLRKPSVRSIDVAQSCVLLAAERNFDRECVDAAIVAQQVSNFKDTWVALMVWLYRIISEIGGPWTQLHIGTN